METTPGPVPPEFDLVSQSFSTSPTLGKFAAALSKAQGMITHAQAGAVNPHFQSSYADLASVLDVCREPLSVCEIARYQAPLTLKTGEVGVKTMLIHSSGEWVASIVWVKPRDSSPQTIGTVISYLRRYSLAAAVGVAQKDDDAEGGEGRGGRAPAAPARPASKTARIAEMPDPQRDASAEGHPEAPTPHPVAPAASKPGVCPVPVPEGKVPTFIFRKGAWDFSGSFGPVVQEAARGRLKALQKELGIPDDAWHQRLCMTVGKASTTDLTEAEAADLAARLEGLKKAKAG